MRRSIQYVEFNRTSIITFCLFEIARFGASTQQLSELRMSLGIVRLDSDRFTNCLFGPPPTPQRQVHFSIVQEQGTYHFVILTFAQSTCLASEALSDKLGIVLFAVLKLRM